MLTYSFSKLQDYSGCPLSFKLRYIDKVGTDDSDALQIGAAAHEFFDLWVKIGHEYATVGGDLDATILKIAGQAFQKDSRDQSNFKPFLEICKTFAKAYQPDSRKYVLTTAEMPIAFTRDWEPTNWDADEVRFRAKLDLVQVSGDFVKITDYKTGFSGKINDFQLDLYAFLISKVMPSVTKVEVSYYYVKSGWRTSKTIAVADMHITQIQLDALLSAVEKDQKFKAKPGSRCLSCYVAHGCKEKATNLVQIDSEVTAKQLASEIVMLDAQAKAKKKSLKTWFDQNGPIETNGITWSAWPLESYTVDVMGFLCVCAEYGLTPADYLTGDTTAIKKLCRQNPELAEKVSGLLQVEQALRFYAKKSNED